MDRVLSFLFAALLVMATAVLADPDRAAAQEGEARLLFEQGNQHLARGLRARGRVRERELTEALDAYLGVLRLGARTQNVVFNLGLTLEELGRVSEAFNYYSEYLHAYELEEDDRAEGQRRLDSLRDRVAVLSIASTPEGAEVRVDRRDLPVRGNTPLEIAVSEGEHRVFLDAPGFEGGTMLAVAAIGQTTEVSIELTPEPVPVQVIAPSRGRLTLDGEPLTAGTTVPVTPGSHVVRLEVEGAVPEERRFEVQAGSPPMVLELSAPAGTVSAPRLAVAIDVPAAVYLDDVPIGQGARVELPITPGDHVVRVEAPGFHPAERRFRAPPGGRVTLNVDLGRSVRTGALDAGRALAGVSAAIGLATGSVFLGLAADARPRYEDAIARQAMNPTGAGETEARELARELEAYTIGTDVAFAITAAIGTVAVILIAIDPGTDETSSIELGAVPSAGGGILQARLRWGSR